MKMDAKFYGEIRKVKDDSIVPDDEYVVFLVKDNAFARSIYKYRDECIALGADQEQIDSVNRMIRRIEDWRGAHPERLKVPDAKGEKLLTAPQPARDATEGAGELVMPDRGPDWVPDNPAIANIFSNEALRASLTEWARQMSPRIQRMVNDLLTRSAAPPKPAPDAMREALAMKVEKAWRWEHRSSKGLFVESLATDEQASIVVALRSAPVPPVDGLTVPLADHDEIGRKVFNQPWEIQSAIVTITAHCTVLTDKYPTGEVADLAGCISQCCSQLADALPSGTGAAEPVAWRCTNSEGQSTFSNSAPRNAHGLTITPLYATPPVRGDREAIARIIDQELFEKYDLETSSGRRAQNGRLWSEVCYREKIDATLAKADAILSLRVQPGAGEREALLKYLDVFLHPNPQVDLSGLTCTHGLAIEACPSRECSNPMAYETAIKRARDYISRQAPHSRSEAES